MNAWNNGSYTYPGKGSVYTSDTRALPTTRSATRRPRVSRNGRRGPPRSRSRAQKGTADPAKDAQYLPLGVYYTRQAG